MSRLRVAALADVHGNSWALEAVVADLEHRDVDEVLNLGDSLYGPLDPAGAARLLMDRGMVSVLGNEDAILLDSTVDSAGHPSWRFTRDRLGAEQLEWLASLPPLASVAGALLLCHGTPASDHEYLLEEVTAGGVRLREPEELERLLVGVGQEVVLCGHSHLPHTVLLPGRRLVVNPGSVGLPAYTGGLPLPHAMESGSPHARYAILERTEAGWRVEHVAVPYDWEPAVFAALVNGRPDWAQWLRTGRAAPG